jgi:nucleotide-binding universal stress UspA family protein
MDEEPNVYVPTDNYVDSEKILDELRSAYESEEQKMLNKYSELAERKGVATKCVLLEGDPASVILNYARNEKYDVIIMGNRGMHSLKELVLGSVSNKILHNSVCPVILIK